MAQAPGNPPRGPSGISDPADTRTLGPYATGGPANPILRYFAHEHLPTGKTRGISQMIGDVARALDRELPPGAELSAGLRKLLEAKDCLVRAALDQEDPR